VEELSARLKNLSTEQGNWRESVLLTWSIAEVRAGLCISFSSH
jgi:hypothetical protein